MSQCGAAALLVACAAPASLQPPPGLLAGKPHVLRARPWPNLADVPPAPAGALAGGLWEELEAELLGLRLAFAPGETRLDAEQAARLGRLAERGGGATVLASGGSGAALRAEQVRALLAGAGVAVGPVGIRPGGQDEVRIYMD